jgi:hypothetical protein
MIRSNIAPFIAGIRAAFRTIGKWSDEMRNRRAERTFPWEGFEVVEFTPQGVTFPRSKPPPIASITITCAVLSVDTQWTSVGPVIKQYCRVQEITSGGIIERVPCFGLNLSPCDAITITVARPAEGSVIKADA